jgi:hypothetical protein
LSLGEQGAPPAACWQSGVHGDPLPRSPSKLDFLVMLCQFAANSLLACFWSASGAANAPNTHRFVSVVGSLCVCAALVVVTGCVCGRVWCVVVLVVFRGVMRWTLLPSTRCRTLLCVRTSIVRAWGPCLRGSGMCNSLNRKSPLQVNFISGKSVDSCNSCTNEQRHLFPSSSAGNPSQTGAHNIRPRQSLCIQFYRFQSSAKRAVAAESVLNVSRPTTAATDYQMVQVRMNLL